MVCAPVHKALSHGGPEVPHQVHSSKAGFDRRRIGDGLGSAEDVGYPFGTVIQLSLLWGTRWGETISCSRAFLDTRERTITLPDTKNGKENCFPYEQMTADILETIPRFNSTDLLFPGKA